MDLPATPPELDHTLLWSALALLLFGVVMVYSASIATSAGSKFTGNQPAYYLVRHGVFVAIGYTPTVDLAKKLGIELTPEGYIRRDSRHRTNVPGIYSAGDVEGGYKQIVTATGQGAEAALAHQHHVAVAVGGDGDRFDQAVGFDAGGELVDRGEGFARLVGIGVDQQEVDVSDDVGKGDDFLTHFLFPNWGSGGRW